MARSKLIGDWDKARRTLTSMVETYNKVGEEPLRKCAERYHKEVIQEIEDQSLEWRPLNPNYASKKKEMGYGEKTLIATHSYVDGILIHDATKVGNQMRLLVGVTEGQIHEPSGLDMTIIASVHEYGSSDGRIPERPHYRPAWKTVLPEINKIWLEYGRLYFRWGEKKL